MKKGIKIILMVAGILIVSFFLISGTSYLGYRGDLNSQSNSASQFEENMEYTSDYEDFDKRGSTNPALRFRNKTTGDVVYYFDHSGKIIAFNITLEENLYAAKNITAGQYGFFQWLGNQANKITLGWFSNINISSTANSSEFYQGGNLVIDTSSEFYYNHTLITYNTWNNDWISTYNASYVPYLNAVSNVDLGIYNITSAFFKGDGSELTGISASVAWNRTGTDVFLHHTGDSVGIGTESPQEKLHVQGTGSQRIEIETDDDNSPVLKITRNNSNSKGIYVDSNAALNFYDYDTATTQMTIGDDGKVGIGTTSPDFDLDVESVASVIRIYATGADSTPNLKLKNDVQTWELRTAGADADRFTIQDTTGSTVPVRIDKATPTNTLRLTSTGFVGVGIGSPEVKLHFRDGGTNTQTRMFLDTFNDQTAYTPEIQFRKSHNDTIGTMTPTIHGEVLGQIRFRGTDSGSAWDDGALIIAQQDGVAGIKVPTNLYLRTNSATALNANQLVLHNDGNVGIGTASPVDLLTVQKSLAANNLVTFNNTNSNQGSVLYLETADGGATAERYLLKAKSNGIDRFIIRNDGNVGIGTTSPDGKLHVHTATAGTVTANTNYDELVLENSNHGGLTILTPNNSAGGVMFGDPEDNDEGRLLYNHDGDYMALFTLGEERIRIKGDGNVGIGVTTPSSALEVTGNITISGTNDVVFYNNGTHLIID